ncbi:MAG TPA: conjugal transfer protein TraF [Gammaproteobacteria bacterium]
MRRWIVLLGFLAVSNAQADPGDPQVYYERHGEGWFWYQDPEPKSEPEKPEAPPPAPIDPIAALSVFQKEIEVAKARAILEPTDANLKAYLRLNQLAMNRAGDFAQAWQRAVWTTPALDTRLTNPVNDQAVQVFNDEKLRLVDDFLVKTARSHGLFFFFKSSCPFCHKLAPILRAFAETYGFHVIPVSLDGGTLPDFPNPRGSTEVAVKLEVDTVPALFLVNPRDRAIHPVAFGYVSWSELRERIYTLLNDRPPNPLMQAQISGDPIDANE